MLKDKSVIVTGSAKGIGRYIARRFAEEGAKVALADMDEPRLRQTEAELAELGGHVLAINTDVRQEEQVRATMAQVAEAFGGIDVLINDAGIVPHFAWGDKPQWPMIRDMDEDFFWNVMRVNLGGTFLCSKHAVPYMEKQNGGHVINISGGGGKTPPGALTYVVSKDAIVTFTGFHAEEVRDANICVVVMGPGGTIATEDAPEEARSRMPGPEVAGNRFLLAAEASMEMSGHSVGLDDDGKLVITR